MFALQCLFSLFPDQQLKSDTHVVAMLTRSLWYGYVSRFAVNIGWLCFLSPSTTSHKSPLSQSLIHLSLHLAKIGIYRLSPLAGRPSFLIRTLGSYLKVPKALSLRRSGWFRFPVTPLYRSSSFIISIAAASGHAQLKCR